MFNKIRHAISRGIMALLEFAGLFLSLSCAAVAVFLGKLFAAAVLTGITIGIFLRIVGRHEITDKPKPTLPWIKLTAAFLAVVEVALLTEATNLPVRFNQSEFEKQNWVFVLLVLFVMYKIQVHFFRSVLMNNHEKT
jgi:NADH:ubiquinone oxidoreductase subunit 6 (subunit J)